MNKQVPEKPTLDGLEEKWGALWEAEGTFRFDRSKTRDEIYSVDTPPPTVSGSLHGGHVFSYTQTDLIVRFQRMRGKEAFYPMGWDDNGLPTERRVQNFYGVRCDPSLPYDSGFVPPEKPGKQTVSISRANFVELCHLRTIEDEKAYEQLWRWLGLSVDWSMTYETIGAKARRASQRSFIRLLDKGLAYQAEAPTLWDIDFQTAVAQAELEDREVAGAFHRVRFYAAEGDVVIETTRPELIPACVALVAHPEDARFAELFGKTVVTPLFRSRVPVLAHDLADPEKGSGIAMICTFGDITDVTWWRELQLPVRGILEPNGRLKAIQWGGDGWDSEDPSTAQVNYDKLAGLTVKKAQAAIQDLLSESGDLIDEPRPITHSVKFYEKGERPLEILTSRQWFIKTLDFKDALLERGRQIDWHPQYMRVRYEDWINGLNGDWCISRQRFFGVPLPVWYPLDEAGLPIYTLPIVPDEDSLPVDPATDTPPGYDESARGQSRGFIGDPDVMDTWATSAMTPQIAGGWEEDPDLFERVFPMDLRPQAHDILRTWLFVTVFRSHLEHDSLPFKNAAIAGWVLDPDRKKLSKSKGNAETPIGLLEEFGSDAVRYWAASGRPGTDTAFDTGQMRVGRRLSIKVLNASRFVLSHATQEGVVTNPVDQSMLAKLRGVVEDATSAFEEYDYTKALERIETFFWTFCDDYLELTKSRAYGSAGDEGAASAAKALETALSALMRLLAPFLPYVTEEVWSWWQEGSVHKSSWPVPNECGEGGDAQVFDLAAEVLGQIRKTKSAAKVSLKEECKQVSIKAPAAALEALKVAEPDLKEAGKVAAFSYQEEPNLSVEVTL